MDMELTSAYTAKIQIYCTFFKVYDCTEIFSTNSLYKYFKKVNITDVFAGSYLHNIFNKTTIIISHL